VVKTACPVCSCDRATLEYTLAATPYDRCANCHAVYQADSPPAGHGENYYDEDYHAARGHGGLEAGIERAKRRSFSAFFRYLPPATRATRLLEIGCGTGDALRAAAAIGFDAVGIDVSSQAIAAARLRFPDLRFHAGHVEQADFPERSFEALVLLDTIEHVAEPHALADTLVRLLAPEGTLLVVTPNAASWSARLLRAKWVHTMIEHVLLHTPQSLDILFARRGLRRVHLGFAWKWINLEMILRHATIHRHVFGVGLLAAVLRALPSSLRQWVFPFNVGELIAVYRKP
jgi:2-polyprenyl-3-methyl-5-hydroxy-6-metoxy-1,4-benzoquinol methylase